MFCVENKKTEKAWNHHILAMTEAPVTMALDMFERQTLGVLTFRNEIALDNLVLARTVSNAFRNIVSLSGK